MVIACGALTLAALLYVFWLTPEPVRAKTPAERELEYLEEKRQVLYENLRDLHLEYRMGKLSDQDYQHMKAAYQADMAALLHQMEQPEASGTGVSPVALPADPSAGLSAGALAEAEAAAKAGLPAEARRAKAGRCQRCSKDNPPENRFCGACGAELPREDKIQ